MSVKHFLVVVTLLASLGIGSEASAATTSPSSMTTTVMPVDHTKTHKDHHAPYRMAYINDAAQILKMDKVTLYNELKSGKSLADVAKEKNVSAEELKKGLQSALGTRLDKAVQKGQITVEQKKEILLRSSQHMDQLINHKGLYHPRHGLKGYLWNETAKILKLDPKTLAVKLKSGKSIAEIAKEQGMSPAEFKQKLLDAENVHLDQAVKNGNLTKEKKQEIINKTKSHIDEWINKKDWAKHEKKD